MQPTLDLKLWHYNKKTNQWEVIKQCREETALVWLAAFQIEQPDEYYRLARKRPSANPTIQSSQQDQ